MPPAASRRLRSAPLCRAAILRWPCTRLLWRARPRGDERQGANHGSFVPPRTGLVGRTAL
jgi:hypothetical protein